MTKIQEDFEVHQTANFELSIFMKMIICSLIGIVSFFITFEWNGKSKRSKSYAPTKLNKGEEIYV